MTDTTMSPTGAATPAYVAGQATKPDELPMDEAVLIGITGADDNPKALFRSHDGRIHVLKKGDLSPLGPILQVDQAGVVVKRVTGNAKFLPPIPIG